MFLDYLFSSYCVLKKDLEETLASSWTQDSWMMVVIIPMMKMKTRMMTMKAKVMAETVISCILRRYQCANNCCIVYCVDFSLQTIVKN